MEYSNEVESVNRPVAIRGSLVDRATSWWRAATVAQAAHAIPDSDKAGRRSLDQELGIPEDDTVRPTAR
jgi:hypothetical protein